MEIGIGVLISIIALFCTVAGLVIGFFTFNRNRDKDVKNDATESAIIRTKLDNIGQSVDLMRIDFKASDQRWTTLSDTVIRIDESTKQAHKRIDHIEKKGEI
ncbi:hypothetical protein ABGT22_08325 [Peribacillus frigoritolerans]|uniref:hypothetical protein n=1 Tax=Peribacillus frigoritolerans TaxID=450367 RepID=UPI00345DC683